MSDHQELRELCEAHIAANPDKPRHRSYAIAEGCLSLLGDIATLEARVEELEIKDENRRAVSDDDDSTIEALDSAIEALNSTIADLKGELAEAAQLVRGCFSEDDSEWFACVNKVDVFLEKHKPTN